MDIQIAPMNPSRAGICVSQIGVITVSGINLIPILARGGRCLLFRLQ